MFLFDRVTGLVDIDIMYLDFSEAFVGVSHSCPRLPFLMQASCFIDNVNILKAEFVSILPLHHHSLLHISVKKCVCYWIRSFQKRWENTGHCTVRWINNLYVLGEGLVTDQCQPGTMICHGTQSASLIWTAYQHVGGRYTIRKTKIKIQKHPSLDPVLNQ